jgi:cytochrome b561
MPVVGFTASNFAKWGVKYFGIQVGPFLAENKAAYEFFQGVHEYVSFLFVTLIAIHVLAAIKHAVVDKDGVFRRMLPG